MSSKLFCGLGAAVLALLAPIQSPAQSYSNAVQALSPAAYWPLTETSQPPQPLSLLATNLGTLGSAADGYYGAWYQPSGNRWFITNNIVVTNGVTGDGSGAMLCQQLPGQYIVVPRNTNGIPNPAVTIVPPFSIEVWAYIGATNGANRTLVSQGQVPVMVGGQDPVNPFYGGKGQGWAGFALGQYQDYAYFSCFCTNATGNKSSELDSSGFNKFTGFKVGTWNHIVATFDGTTEQVWTNGVLAAQKNVSANGAGLRYVPDPTTPLMIGNGNDVSASSGMSPYAGALDEVAIYPSVLSQGQIQAHYAAVSTTGYKDTVLQDSPMIYYRLDDGQTNVNAGYPSASFPVANNYGVVGAAANGVYQPGTVPGVAGPQFAGFGPNSRAVALNGFFGAVDVGGGNLPAELNPTNTAPLTVVSWFQGGPADSPARFQEIVGHGNNSYRLAMGQTAGENRFNPGPGPEIQFISADDLRTNGWALNDGKWHMVAGVSDGTNAYLYLDGMLARSSNTVSGINIVGSTTDLLLGGDSQFTAASASSANTIRTFDGQIAHVAFWTNALSSANIQQLYGAAGVPPMIVQQPQPASVNAGTNVTLSVSVRGSAPFNFQWYQNDGTVTGGTGSSLTFNPIVKANEGAYYVVVSSSYGSVTSSVVQVSVIGAPLVTQQTPASLKVFSGSSPTLRVRAIGPAFTYQWSLNGSTLSGATQSSYTLTNIQSGGTYTCALVNGYGTTPITPISVSVLASPAAAYPAAVLADRPVSYWRLNEMDGLTAFDYVGGLNATYTNVMLGQGGYSPNDPTMTSAQFGIVNPTDSFAGNTPDFVDVGMPTNNNSQFSIECWVNGGLGQSLDAGVVTLGYGNGGEQFNLDTGASPGHKFRFFVRDSAGATHLVAGNVAPSDNAWHHVVGVCDEANGKVYLYVDGRLNGSASITPNSGLLKWNTPLSIGSRKSGQNTAYDSQFVGNINDVALYNVALSSNQVVSHYYASGVAPQITLEPTNAIVNEGGTAYFYAGALGTTPLSYFWYQLGGAEPLAGQTTATLTLSNVTSAMSGNYYQLLVTNVYGQAYSGLAQLIVNAGPPYIDVDLQPLFAQGWSGTPFTYSVGVSGSGPFTYEWRRNDSVITGATNSTYTFATLPGTNYYQVIVRNVGGSASSSVATNVGVAAPTLSPADYTYHAKITFTGYTRAEALRNFPALIKLGSNLPGFSYAQLASPAGGDLRFTDASGTREIPHEIDEWDPNGTSSVWVQVPALTGTNDYIMAYWGNPAATSPLAWSTNGGVWMPPFNSAAGYQVVYHLKESSLPFADSTLQHPATGGVAPSAAPGIVGTGGQFNGGAWLDAGMADVGDAFTLSAWVNPTPGALSISTVWANKGGGWNANGFAFHVNTWNTTDGTLHVENGNGTGGQNPTSAAGAVSAGSWHLLTALINRTNSSAVLYVDGAQVVSGAVVPDFTTAADLNLGRFSGGGFEMRGTMDEARVQSGTVSPNWIWADYMTVAQNTAFQTYSTVVSSAVTLTYTVSGGNMILSWPQGTLQWASEANGSWNDITGAASGYSVPLSGPQKFFRIKVR